MGFSPDMIVRTFRSKCGQDLLLCSSSLAYQSRACGHILKRSLLGDVLWTFCGDFDFGGEAWGCLLTIFTVIGLLQATLLGSGPILSVHRSTYILSTAIVHGMLR